MEADGFCIQAVQAFTETCLFPTLSNTQLSTARAFWGELYVILSQAKEGYCFLRCSVALLFKCRPEEQ